MWGGPAARAVGGAVSKIPGKVLDALPLGAAGAGYYASDEPDFKGKATDALLSWFLAKTIRGGRRRSAR